MKTNRGSSVKTAQTPRSEENSGTTTDLLADILSKAKHSDASDPSPPESASGPLPRLDGVVIGWIAGKGPDHRLLVDYHGNDRGQPLPVVSTAGRDKVEAGTQVALAFDGGDPARPMVLGVIQVPGSGDRSSRSSHGPLRHVAADLNETLTFTAEKEIVLKCGKASVTLTRDGKIEISGTYLLSRSKGVNRIMGGSVQLN